MKIPEVSLAKLRFSLAIGTFVVGVASAKRLLGGIRASFAHLGAQLMVLTMDIYQ